MLGLIGRKVGMTQVFDHMGKLTPVTVIKIDPNIVIAERKVEKDGYSAVVIGSVEGKEKHFTKAVLGQYPEGQKPQRVLVEFKDFSKDVKIGDSFGVELLDGLSHVDVLGTSKGKGFQGVVRRHHFKGGEEAHGSKFGREQGGTGNSTTPGETAKGTKGAGRMGGESVTVQSLEVLSRDNANQVVIVKGAIPGPKNSFVIVKQAKKKPVRQE